MPFIHELLKYTNDYFVETGSFRGETTELVKNSGLFKHVYSLELSDVFFEDCTTRLKGISFYKANSKTDLYSIIHDIKSPITFWLDSHWSGTANVGCDPTTICPVLEELEQIKRHPIKNHIIMIDDIRLMDGRHFPVKVDQIIAKLADINPNYVVRIYPDSESTQDIFVAFVPEESRPLCIHNYLTQSSVNKQPPGFADFLRGTIALYKYSKEYNYRLLLNRCHPLFEYLDESKYLIHGTPTTTIELIPGSTNLSYLDIDARLGELFKNGVSFQVLTNSFYTKTDTLYNFGVITEDCREFLQDILKPNDSLKKEIFHAYKAMGLDLSRPYSAIHLRFGDAFLHQNVYSEEYLNHVNPIVKQLLAQAQGQLVLLTDSKVMGLMLKKLNPALLYWDNEKTHLGDILNTRGVSSALVDFFILSKADKIFNNGSGFSEVISVIYGKPLIRIL